MITNFQKQIYNNFLVASRKSQNKPFQIRKNFDKMEEDVVVLLNKLSDFFNEYKHVNQQDFFVAPYKIYDDVEYYKLDYFTTAKARKAYAAYMKKLELEDPDSSDALVRLRDSLKFVYEFCLLNDLTFEEYPVYVESSLPCMIEHLKNHDINYYTLHALKVSRLNIESRTLDFIFGDFYGTLQKTKNKFYASKKMKEFANKAITQQTKKLNKTENN
jgi:hypothetical protein